jgi:hypothetical protein
MIVKYLLIFSCFFHTINITVFADTEALNVTVDGVAAGTVNGIFNELEPLFDAKQMAPLLTAKFYRIKGLIPDSDGFIYQYGKTISLVYENNDNGFVACVETPVIPNVQADETGNVYSPYSFLAAAVNGDRYL